MSDELQRLVGSFSTGCRVGCQIQVFVQFFVSLTDRWFSFGLQSLASGVSHCPRDLDYNEFESFLLLILEL
jgi:hypothetical protein